MIVRKKRHFYSKEIIFVCIQVLMGNGGMGTWVQICYRSKHWTGDMHMTEQESQDVKTRLYHSFFFFYISWKHSWFSHQKLPIIYSVSTYTVHQILPVVRGQLMYRCHLTPPYFSALIKIVTEQTVVKQNTPVMVLSFILRVLPHLIYCFHSKLNSTLT